MSKETLEYLQRNVLIGFTERRGHAWHFRPELQGPEPNHYPDAIPEEDVNRRLFDWEAVERPVFVENADGRRQMVPGYKAIVHGTTGQLFNVVRRSYVMHQYGMWLTQTLKSIVNETDLRIGSAGLLGGGAQAFVMIQTPEALRSAWGSNFFRRCSRPPATTRRWRPPSSSCPRSWCATTLSPWPWPRRSPRTARVTR